MIYRNSLEVYARTHPEGPLSVVQWLCEPIYDSGGNVTKIIGLQTLNPATPAPASNSCWYHKKNK